MSVFQRLFRRPQPQKTTTVEVMSGSPAHFTPFSGGAYESDIYRSAVDAIARNAAKLKGSHVVSQNGQRKTGDPVLNRLLQVRPNQFMSAFDVQYKLVTHYYLHNNAFAFLQKSDTGQLEAIWPLRPVSMEFVTDPTGELYCKFIFAGGQTVILPFGDVVILRRHFNGNDLLGDSNRAIIPTLDLAHTQSEGLQNAIKAGATIRGILKYSQVLAPDKLKEEKEAFIRDYLSVANEGGIAALDAKAEYVPLEMKPYAIDSEQLKSIKDKVYGYLGISEAIVTSSYDEDGWAAFYESVIEPIALQLSLELTSKVFTQREQGFGNSIMYEANRLQFASSASKVNILKELMPLQLFTINQALEILNLPAVEDGDRRVQTLNVVDADLVNEYQIAKSKTRRTPNVLQTLEGDKKPDEAQKDAEADN